MVEKQICINAVNMCLLPKNWKDPECSKAPKNMLEHTPKLPIIIHQWENSIEFVNYLNGHFCTWVLGSYLNKYMHAIVP